MNDDLEYEQAIQEEQVHAQALEYERALLGAVLHGYHRDIPELCRVISKSDFYRIAHGDIWDHVVALYSEGTTPDPLTVKDRMGAAAFKLPGGPIYLSSTLAEPIGAMPGWLAQKVRESAIRREISDMGVRCRQMVATVDKSPEDMVAQIRTWADSITMSSTTEITSMQSVLERVIDIAEHGLPNGSPSPWPSVDELTGGWYPGQLVTFGARPGVGKSIALENVATYTARREKCWVLFVSLEMSPEEIGLRTMAHTAGVELKKLRAGRLSEQDWQRVHNASGVMGETRMKFADMPSQTVASIRAAAWDAHQEAKRQGERLGMVVIDYVQLITPASSKDMTRQQQLGAITRGLKQLARELEVPVVTAAQLNRQPGVPILAHLREAGDIEQDSDVVILLHEESVEDAGRTVPTGELQMIVAKNRNGATAVRTVTKIAHYSNLYDEPSPR